MATQKKKNPFKSFFLSTNGKGFWSGEKRGVKIKRVEVNGSLEDNGEMYGELRMFFTKSSWDITKHGLIYTDPLFMKEFHAIMKSAGIDPKSVDYSEQGMQGDDYVSCDINGKIAIEAFKSFGC